MKIKATKKKSDRQLIMTTKTKCLSDPTTTSSPYNPPNFPISPSPKISRSHQPARSSDLGRLMTTCTAAMSLPPPPSQEQENEYRPPIRKQGQQIGQSSLYKQHSWSPDIYREEAWQRRKGNYKKKKSRSVTDEDLDELKGCIELGFGFDSPELMDQRLSDTLPALELYYAVNKNYYDSVSKSLAITPSLSTVSDGDSRSPVASRQNIFVPGDDPETVKTRLRQWAQVVACSARQCSG